MDDLDNKFLHKINLETLKKETGMGLDEIAELVGVGPKVVYKWQSLKTKLLFFGFNKTKLVKNKPKKTKPSFSISISKRISIRILFHLYI